MESLYAVILNWNLPEITIDCVRSLLAEGLPAEQILIVDNGSTDGSMASLRMALGPAARLIRSEANLGFAGGCNLGIRAALEAGAEWVLLLNNDTIAQAGFVGELARAARLHPDIRLWGPLILYHAQPDTVWALGDRRIAGTLLTRHIARNRVVPAALPDFIPVDFLTGCALSIHADVFRSVGLLDDSYFMYVEDADFCVRAQQAGFRLACWTLARLLHRVSLSSGPESPQARFWRTGYQARFYRSHAGGLQRVLLFCASTLRTAALSTRDRMGGRRALAAAGVDGWRRGWFAPKDAPLQRLTRRDATPATNPAAEANSWNR